VVDVRLGGSVVVDVLHVEVGVEAPALELPPFVEAEVELVEEREALAELLAVDGEVGPRVARVDGGQGRGAHEGRGERAAHDAETRADLPAAPEAVAAE